METGIATVVVFFRKIFYTTDITCPVSSFFEKESHTVNIEYLKYFSAVAKLGSINKAAHELFISQPHLGNIIRDLEAELGTTLFQRTSQGVTLTADGVRFLDHASRILEEYKDFFDRGMELDSSASLEISMTKFSHIMESFIEVVIHHKNDPGFSHHLNEGSPEDVVDDISSNLSQIGVLNFDVKRRDYFLEMFRSRHLDYHVLAYACPCILVSNDHPLLKEGKEIDLSALSDYVFVRYIGQYEDFMNRIQIEQGIANLNKSKRIIYVHGRTSLLHMIGKSDFYGIGIHGFDMQESVYNVRSIPIKSCSDMLEFGYIVPQRTNLSPITREFIDNLTNRFKSKQ